MSPGRGPSPFHHVPVEWHRPGRCTSLQFQRGSAQVTRLVASQGCPGRSGRGRTHRPPTTDARTRWPRWPRDRGRPAPPARSPGTPRTRRRHSSLAGPPRTRAFRPPSPGALRSSPLPQPQRPPFASPQLTSRAAAAAATAAAAAAATTRSRETSLRPAPTLLPLERGQYGHRPGSSGKRRAHLGGFTTCLCSPTQHPPAPVTGEVKAQVRGRYSRTLTWLDSSACAAGLRSRELLGCCTSSG